MEERARVVAEGQEKNAWQVKEALDRAILGALLATVVLALGAGFLRAAGRRFRAPWTPSALAAAIAVLSALLIGYRMLDSARSRRGDDGQVGRADRAPPPRPARALLRPGGASRGGDGGEPSLDWTR